MFREAKRILSFQLLDANQKSHCSKLLKNDPCRCRAKVKKTKHRCFEVVLCKAQFYFVSKRVNFHYFHKLKLWHLTCCIWNIFTEFVKMRWGSEKGSFSFFVGHPLHTYISIRNNHKYIFFSFTRFNWRKYH